MRHVYAGQTDGRTDRRTDGRTDRRTDGHRTFVYHNTSPQNFFYEFTSENTYLPKYNDHLKSLTQEKFGSSEVYILKGSTDLFGHVNLFVDLTLLNIIAVYSLSLSIIIFKITKSSKISEEKKTVVEFI